MYDESAFCLYSRMQLRLTTRYFERKKIVFFQLPHYIDLSFEGMIYVIENTKKVILSM